MGKLRLFPVIIWVLTLWFAAAPSHAEGTCYLRSELVLFEEVVQIVAVEADLQSSYWRLRLRLQGKTTSQGHAMFCGSNACDPGRPEPSEGLYWLAGSQANRNVASLSKVENRSCADVTFYIVPINKSESIWLDLAALYEEGYFVLPTILRPRWSRGVIGISALDGRSHCQDDGPESEIVFGSICLQQ